MCGWVGGGGGGGIGINVGWGGGGEILERITDNDGRPSLEGKFQ